MTYMEVNHATLMELDAWPEGKLQAKHMDMAHTLSENACSALALTAGPPTCVHSLNAWLAACIAILHFHVHVKALRTIRLVQLSC